MLRLLRLLRPSTRPGVAVCGHICVVLGLFAIHAAFGGLWFVGCLLGIRGPLSLGWGRLRGSTFGCRGFGGSGLGRRSLLGGSLRRSWLGSCSFASSRFGRGFRSSLGRGSFGRSGFGGSGLECGIFLGDSSFGRSSLGSRSFDGCRLGRGFGRSSLALGGFGRNRLRNRNSLGGNSLRRCRLRVGLCWFLRILLLPFLLQILFDLEAFLGNAQGAVLHGL